MRWPGFRKVRGQVCKRLRRRLSELQLSDLTAYRAHLERHPQEWRVLDDLVHITISRFNRDRGVFAFLQDGVLPALADDAESRHAHALEVWSAGCASGEEPYTLAIMWQLELARCFPALAIRILATDQDETMLARARRGCFPEGSLRELPDDWRSAAFSPVDRQFCLDEAVRQPVRIVRHDIREPPPGGPFDLVLCRNLAFTYFDLDLQRGTAVRIAGALRAGGALVLGAHESLPVGVAEFEPWSERERVYRRS
jgi:chemotaxis protein methyltransferase CheR